MDCTNEEELELIGHIKDGFGIKKKPSVKRA
jgi:hypothetical protein